MRYYVEIELKNKPYNVGFYINAESAEAATPTDPVILPKDGSGYDPDCEIVLVDATE